MRLHEDFRVNILYYTYILTMERFVFVFIHRTNSDTTITTPTKLCSSRTLSCSEITDPSSLCLRVCAFV